MTMNTYVPYFDDYVEDHDPFIGRTIRKIRNRKRKKRRQKKSRRNQPQPTLRPIRPPKPSSVRPKPIVRSRHFGRISPSALSRTKGRLANASLTKKLQTPQVNRFSRHQAIQHHAVNKAAQNEFKTKQEEAKAAALANKAAQESAKEEKEDAKKQLLKTGKWILIGGVVAIAAYHGYRMFAGKNQVVTTPAR